MNTLVIIGTGLAGYNLAKEFRKLDAERPLLLITAPLASDSWWGVTLVMNRVLPGQDAHLPKTARSYP